MRLFNWMLGPGLIFESMHSNARLPTHGSPNAVGFDLYSPRADILMPGVVKMIPLGLKSKFRNDWAALIWDRSGMGKAGMHRLAGVVDPDYRGEWKVLLLNTTNEKYYVSVGARIAQAVLTPVFAGPCYHGTVADDTARGDGGYGSTGH